MAAGWGRLRWDLAVGLGSFIDACHLVGWHQVDFFLNPVATNESSGIDDAQSTMYFCSISSQRILFLNNLKDRGL